VFELLRAGNDLNHGEADAYEARLEEFRVALGKVR
jgi:hypothetical protein